VNLQCISSQLPSLLAAIAANYGAAIALHRRVAVKLIRADRLSDVTLHRFTIESEVLGRLQHAGIAQIYEAGTAVTPFGTQPFFAIELIEGRPLDQYAAQEKLGIRDRLDLMLAERSVFGGSAR
jgi:hypothetical protein